MAPKLDIIDIEEAIPVAAEDNMDAPTRMKMYQSALRSLPKFSGTKGDRWAYHVHALNIWRSANNIAEITTAEQQKLAVLSSLTGPAMRAVELHGPGKPSFTGAATWEDFITVITRVFQPQAESNLSRLEFEAYRQAADEPISQYGSTKLSLYHQSEPNEGARSFAYLRSQMLSGIFSGHIKSEIIRMNPQNQEELLNAMITSVGQACEAYQMGCSIVPNLDGLASTTRLSGGWNQNQGEEPMEVDALRRIDKRCYKCNKTGHLQKDCRVKKKPDGNRASGSQRTPGTGQGPRGNSRDSKDIICFYCNKKGHKAQDCFKKKRDKQENKQKSVKKTAQQQEKEEEEEWSDIEEIVGKLGMEDFPWGVSQS